MALEPDKTTWNPNRYKATEYVITYDASGNAQLTQKAADYTGVSYNFSQLPTNNTQNTTTNTQTSTNTAQTSTTQEQTTEAFGDVKPHWWKTASEEGGGGGNSGNTFPSQTKNLDKSSVTGFDDLKTSFKRNFVPDYYNYQGDFEQDEGTIYDLDESKKPSLVKRSFDTITKPFKAVKEIGTKAKKGLMDKVYLPGITAAKAVGQMVRRPNANESFRGIPGLYQAEVDNMKRYGSTGPTAGNPTGDPRKDDAGYNIVSWKGNYNAIGTGSRRSNMLKDATEGMVKGSAEWKEARNTARDKWQEEKDWSDNWEREQRDTDRDRTREEKKEQTRRDTLTSQFASEEGPSDGGSSKIVCTMMNDSYGFGSFRNKIWMKFHKDLSPEYQKGYHKLFLPLVRIAKKNKIVKKVLEHIAVHSTLDMRQSLRGKKHLLGRIYRRIILPICYWAGKK